MPKGSRASISHKLEIAYGTLTLALSPENAQATIETANGEILPYRHGMRLPEGAYRLEVSQSGHVTATQAVDIAGDTALAVSLETAPPLPVAESAAPGGQPTVPAVIEVPDCKLLIGRRPLDPGYPGSRNRTQSSIKDTTRRNPRNYGDATVAVRFSVNDDGRVSNASVTVDRDRSSATRPQFFELFAASAKRSITGYRFRIAEPEGEACNRAQEGTIAFRFSYR